MEHKINLCFWISVLTLFSFIQCQQTNNYAGLEKIYDGILQGYNRNLRPGKILYNLKVSLRTNLQGQFPRSILLSKNQRDLSIKMFFIHSSFYKTIITFFLNAYVLAVD